MDGTLSEICVEYCRAKSHDLESSTKRTVQTACRWFDQYAGGVPLSAVDESLAESYKQWLVTSGRSKNTANMYVRSIQPVVRYAMRRGWLSVNPFAGVSQFRVTPKPVTVYEDWQFERMLKFLPRPTKDDPQRDIRWLGLLWGARTTGFRRGCLLNLTQEAVRGGMVWVEPKKKTATTWPWEPKDREIRKVPLAPQFAEVWDYLKGHRYPLVCPAMAEKLLVWQKDTTTDPVALDRWRKCPELNFRRTFQTLQRKAFGHQIGDWHQFRRTYTTDMAEVLPDRAVMELTGHSKRETLDRYTGVRRSHWQTAYDVVSSVLKKGPRGFQPGNLGGLQAIVAGPSLESGR